MISRLAMRVAALYVAAGGPDVGDATGFADVDE